MLKEIVCFSFFVVVCVIMVGCKSVSYGSSHSITQSESKSQLVIEDEDCFAWKFYLFTSMHDIVHQGAIQTINRMRSKYLDRLEIDGPPVIDMNKVLPPKTVQEIMNTIIKREGGHCSKEVLYEITPCAYDHITTKETKRYGGFVYASSIYAKIDFDYFSKSMGIPVSKDLLVKYEKFLDRHVSKSLLNEHYRKTRIVCEDHCDDGVFSVSYKNGLGTCMLEKHRTYFKENNIFDFGEFFYWERYGGNPELHIPSMESYIEETNRIAEEYKKNGL